MDLRSGRGGAAALAGAVLLGVLASVRSGQRGEKEAPEPPAWPVSTESPAVDTAADARSPDSLERPLDEIRTFFGYPRVKTGQPAAGAEPKTKPREVSELAREIRGMAEKRGYELRFLIALVPDPIGSYIGSQFDAYQTALVRGATACGWLPDRHWLPWQEREPAEDGGGESRPAQAIRSTRSPGIVLFRNASARILSAVFLVGESPVTGIHKRAFVDALRLISAVRAREDIRVLGPFSSGAASSCAMALEDWYSRAGEPRAPSVQFISGSATNPELADRLRPHCPACGSLTVRFRRTVASDGALQNAAFRFFEDELGWHHHEIAVLAESDTFYGNALPPGGAEHGPSGHWRLLLPVPSAISSVRTAWERTRKPEEVEIGGVKVPAPGLELKLDESRAPRDKLPAFDRMTAPLTEIELDSLLSALAREKIHHLGLVFTDIRDRLFVAEKIDRYASHVSLFTFESNGLYVHPRVNSYTDGMLVVSSYPLSMVTQQLMGGPVGAGERRVQFGSDPEQGFYNATVIAMSEPGRPAPVADYLTIPQTPWRAPAVWISAVGDGRLVPLAVRRYQRSEISEELETADRSHAADSGDRPPRELERLIARLEIPSGFRFCFWIATIAFALLALSLLFACRPGESERLRGLSAFLRPLLRAGRAERRQLQWWSVVLVGLAAIVWTALATVYVVPALLRMRWGISAERTGDPHDWFAWVEGIVLPAVARLLPAIPPLLVAALAGLGWIMDRVEKDRRRPVFALVLGSTIAVACVVSWRALAPFRSESFDRLDVAVFTFLRASAGPMSLSPLVGTLLLVIGIALLVLFQIQRLRIRDAWRCHLPVEAFAESEDLPLRSLAAPQAQVDRIIREPISSATWFWASFLILLGPVLIGFLFRFEASCERPVWSKTFAVLFGFILLPASMATFSRFASLWRALQRLIVRQEWSRLLDAFRSCQEELDWHPLRAWGSERKHNYSLLVGSVELLRRLSLRSSRPRVTEDVGRMLGSEPVHLSELAGTAKGALAEAMEANAKRDWNREADARLRTIQALDDASQHVQLMLNRLDASGADTSHSEIGKELTRYLAFRGIAYIRYVFSVIRNSLLAFTIGILFLLAGLASFHFQPIRSVYVLLWSVIGVVAVWTTVLFIEMERNTVLAKIADKDPGELNPIRSGFLGRVATFVLPPVVGLIVTQFPQLGRPLVDWLNPLLRLFQ